MFDIASATQADYAASAVTATNEAVTVHFHEARLGLDALGTIEAYAHVDGHDTQAHLPVALLR